MRIIRQQFLEEKIKMFRNNIEKFKSEKLGYDFKSERISDEEMEKNLKFIKSFNEKLILNNFDGLNIYMNIEYFINYLKELISKCDTEIIIVDKPTFLIDDNIYEPKALTVLTYKMETFTVKELVDEFNKYETVYLYTIFRTPSSNCFIVRYVGENKLENFN